MKQHMVFLIAHTNFRSLDPVCILVIMPVTIFNQIVGDIIGNIKQYSLAESLYCFVHEEYYEEKIN